MKGEKDRLRTELLMLEGNTAHVWAVDLERETHLLAEVLSADEWARADRFLFEKHRAHFVAARGCLRAILAKYMECKPGELAFFMANTANPLWHLLGINPNCDSI